MKGQNDSGQENGACLDREVYVVGHEAVRIDSKTKSIPVMCETSKVNLSIGVGSKDIALLVAPCDHVVDGARKLQTQRPRHQSTGFLYGVGNSVLLACREEGAERLG